MTDTTLNFSKPSLALLTAEPWRATAEFLSFKLLVDLKPKYKVKIKTFADVPISDREPVIIFPGMATDGKAVAPLRRFCQSLGYNAMDWGKGLNTGPRADIDAWLVDLAEHTSTLLRGRRQPATLIGWSLGGIYARELGKLLAPKVKQVITIATPFNADADHTHVGWIFKLLSGASAQFPPALNDRLRTPPPVPTTSIYSRSDGVVAWQTCIHTPHVFHDTQVEDVQVSGSHIGMGWNPQVLKIVADRLAQPAGQWTPYAQP